MSFDHWLWAFNEACRDGRDVMWISTRQYTYAPRNLRDIWLAVA